MTSTASTSVVEATPAPSPCAASQRKAVIAERFKTKMCKNWEKHGDCPYEWRCMFAHGEHELRSKQRNLDDNLTTEDAIHEFQRAKRTAERAEAASREVEMPRPRSLVSGACARSANSTPPPPASPELSAHYRHHLHRHHQHFAMTAHLPHTPAAAVVPHSRPATPVPTHEVRVPCGDHVHHHHGHSHSHDSDRWRRDPYAPRSPAAVHDLVTSGGLDSSSAMGSATFSFEHPATSHSEVGTPRPSSVVLPAARTTSPPPPPVASLGSPVLQRWSGGDATGAAGDFDGPATPVPVSSWWWSSPSNETVGVMHDRTPSVRSDTTATSTAASEDAAARDALTAAAEDGTMVFVDGY